MKVKRFSINALIKEYMLNLNGYYIVINMNRSNDLASIISSVTKQRIVPGSIHILEFDSIKDATMTWNLLNVHRGIAMWLWSGGLCLGERS